MACNVTDSPKRLPTRSSRSSKKILSLENTQAMHRVANWYGKTIVFAAIAKSFARRTLILAHRDELIQQAVAKIKLSWRQADIGIVKANYRYHHQIVVGSVQSMHKKRLKL